MPSRVPPSVQVSIVSDYESGSNTGELGAKYGWSTTTVQRVLKENGVTLDRSRSGAASWEKRNDVEPDEGDQETGTRQCKVCRKRKSMSEFYWTKPQKINRSRKCKKCHYKQTASSPNRRSNKLKYAYGITLGDFNAMLSMQKGSCAVCRDTLTRENRQLHIDHCHFDGLVRGLLCHRCNTGLGLFRDDPDILKSAAEYIMQDHWHPEMRA